MPPHSLTPVFTGLRTGLHVLFFTLLGLVTVRIALGEAPSKGMAYVVAALFAGTYVAGAAVAKVAGQRRVLAGTIWLVLLSLEWAALLVLIPEAAYLVFPLFFLYLHVLPALGGALWVMGATAVAILVLGARLGFTVGGVVGPLVGAGVALLIGLGYRALAREAAERELLVGELVATRDQLAATEREQGILAERARLAREIHDTVAQGLSSIQMLLHAAERLGGEGPGIEHVVLARKTAAEALAETRRFIRELSPPSLDRGLPSALRRLADMPTLANTVAVHLEAPERMDLPMDVQTALLRVAQSALANVVQHAQASRVWITLAEADAWWALSVKDDGVGFDPGAGHGAPSSDSFGLRAIAERIKQIGGSFDLMTAPGEGTALTVRIDRSRR